MQTNPQILMNPDGTLYWSADFLPIRLIYVMEDGREMTSEMEQNILNFGLGFFQGQFKKRVFYSYEAAVDFGNKHGLTKHLNNSYKSSNPRQVSDTEIDLAVEEFVNEVKPVIKEIFRKHLTNLKQKVGK